MTMLGRRGAIADRLWEYEGGSAPAIARRVRALGLDFVILRLGRDELSLVPDGARSRLDEAAATLRASGVELWGLGALGAGPLPAAAALARDLCASLQLAAWIVEPAQAGDDTVLAEHLRLLRVKLAGKPIGLLHAGPDPGQFAGLLELVDWRLARLTGDGSIGLAVAAGRRDPVMVPVLSLTEGALQGQSRGQLEDAASDRAAQVLGFQRSASLLDIERIVLDGWDLLPATLSLPQADFPASETIEDDSP